MLRRPPSSPHFPYTTLFRSARVEQKQVVVVLDQEPVGGDSHRCATTDVPHQLGVVDDDGAVVEEVDLHVEPPRSEDTRLNSSHVEISYAVFCLKKKRLGEMT